VTEFTWVYKYKYWDEDHERFEMSRGYFTLEAIKAGLGSIVLESGIKVRADEVDEGGRYRGAANAAPASERGNADAT
jgi:hypothetical protein